MRNKISFYLFKLKIKFIILTLFFLCLFIQIINLIEVSRLLESENFNIWSIFYLSSLKLPGTTQEIVPFVIIVSTAFFYRYLINNNEFIAMRNVGYSIIDIFKPVGIAIIATGIFFLCLINPLTSLSENKFEILTSKDVSSFYSIKIKNNEIWIKNKQEYKANYIKFSNFDLKNMNADKIKIIEVEDGQKKFYIAEEGTLKKNILELKNLNIFDINTENTYKLDDYSLEVNFSQNDIINSFSNYKIIPFYKYKQHISSLKKFNLYSQEISLFYLSEVLKPIFLLILSFVVMGFSSKFKRNESFFKILFFSILIGFIFFMYNEILEAITIANYSPYWLSYSILIISSTIIGLYQSINIEVNQNK